MSCIRLTDTLDRLTKHVPQELEADAQRARARERLHRGHPPLLHRLVVRPEHEVLRALLLCGGVGRMRGRNEGVSSCVG